MATSLSGCFEIGGIGSGTICATIILVIDVIVIVDVVRKDEGFFTGLLWSMVIVCLPVIGLVAWVGKIGSDEEKAEKAKNDAAAAIEDKGSDSEKINDAPRHDRVRTPRIHH